MTASDIALKVAQRAGLRTGEVTSTTTVYEHVSQAGTSDWDLLQRLAADVGFEVTVREGKFGFGPPTAASGAPAAGGAENKNPLVLKLGADLLRFRAVVTSAEQVKEVEVRGWDTATKQALTATKPAATTSVVLPDTDPAKLAKTFGDARYVSTDVPHRTQAEVDVAAAALAEAVAGMFAEFEGVARGNPEVRAGAAITMDGLGSPFDGKYTVTTSRHRLDPTTGYTTSFSVTGVRDRTHARASPSGGGPATTAPPGVVVAVVDDVNDPEKTGRVRLRFPWLDDTYVSGWARTVQAGAGKDRGRWSCPRWATRCWSSSSRATSGVPTCSAASTTAWTSPSPQGHPGRRRRQGHGQPALVRLAPRTPDRPPRRGRQDRGRHRRQRRRQGQPEAGRDRHQGDGALRRHGADRGHPGHHGRLGQREARAQGRPDLAHGHPGRHRRRRRRPGEGDLGLARSTSRAARWPRCPPPS